MQLVADFAAYAKTVVAALADKVVYWTTFNEPQSICLLGFGYGGNAPGIDLHLAQFQSMRAEGRTKGRGEGRCICLPEGVGRWLTWEGGGGDWVKGYI